MAISLRVQNALLGPQVDKSELEKSSKETTTKEETTMHPVGTRERY